MYHKQLYKVEWQGTTGEWTITSTSGHVLHSGPCRKLATSLAARLNKRFVGRDGIRPLARGRTMRQDFAGLLHGALPQVVVAS